MADIKPFFPKILKFEGGFVNDKLDSGGATNFGVTLATWRQVGYDKDGDGDIDVEDMKKLSTDDAMMVCKKFYWDRWKADNINSQSVAEQLVDWVWASGAWGIKIPQQILGVVADGSVGDKTIQALNAHPAQDLHRLIVVSRLNFIDGIIHNSVETYISSQKAKNPNYIVTDADILSHTQKRFEKGWKNRINALTFVS